MKFFYWLMSIVSFGYSCPKCGGERIDWRDGHWACTKCDLT